MRGVMKRRVLEAIAEGVRGVGDLFEVFLEAGYGASSQKLLYKLERKQAQREQERSRNEIKWRLKQRYYNLLSQLKRDGLITEDRSTITKKGKQYLTKLRQMRETALPRRAYSVVATKSFVIVTFDVPERVRWKRDWLRMVLRQLGLTMVQKSVWIGKIKIPKAFIDDLAELELLDAVQIVEARKAGSLAKLF